jgi:redox-sensitive bicupin YhaK (pirin superfamily)
MLRALPDWTPSELAYLAADAEDRRAALAAAAVLLGRRSRPDSFAMRSQPASSTREWLQAASAAYGWLQGRDSLKAVQIFIEAGKPQQEGTPVTTSLNLVDNQTVGFTLSGADSKGIQVPAPADTWAWASDDTAGAIGTLTVSADTLSATVAAVAPGTLTLSVTGATSGLTGAEAIIVTAGPAVTIDLVPGTPAAE